MALLQQLVLFMPYVKETKLPQSLTLFWYKMICFVLGLKIQIKGNMTSHHPALFVANHSSYIDILVLGAIVKGSFISKAEVAKWPFVGWVSKMHNTVFLDRKALNIHHHKEEITQRLTGLDSLILFPEGTTSDGNRVLPFKSALFSVSELKIDNKEIYVQPVTIAYTCLDGLPMGRHFRSFYAWYGDMELSSHLLKMLGLGRVTVDIVFHEPVTFEAYKSRKKLAEHCEQVVRNGLSHTLADAHVIHKKNFIKRRLIKG